MSNYGVVYDGVFGDISFDIQNSSIDVDVEYMYDEYLMNMIRNRLKSLDGDYGQAYKYNIFKNIGLKNSIDMETAMRTSVRNMLTYDALVPSVSNLEVAALRSGHKMTIGIRLKNMNINRSGYLDMVLTRNENGKAE
jgi:hypothetical protein